MEGKIQQAAAAFYKRRAEKDTDGGFIHYGELAKSAIAASDVMPLSGELKKMIQTEKDVLGEAYFEQNSALFIILNKLLEQRGVKDLSNMFKKTNAFTNNAVFSFKKPQVAEPVEPEGETKEKPVKGEPVKGEPVKGEPVKGNKGVEEDVPVAEAVEVPEASAFEVPTARRFGGGRTRSLLQRIRTLTKKNIRRMV